jgi:MoaA/NifB/PqqE/SkfB family radical SAM enzyme
MGSDFRTLRRSLGAFVSITLNRMLGRTYVPRPRKQIFIETSSRCNLACRFCAYPKRTEPGSFMDPDRFRALVDEAAALGCDQVVLTPMLGEMFADPTIGEKFAILEAHEGIRSFLFYSNFILPDADAVRALGALKKLREIHISVYGHDLDSFTAVTRKPAAQYDRLAANLETLSRLPALAERGCIVHFSVRTVAGIGIDGLPETEVTRPLLRLRDEGRAVVHVADTYDTWGGTVTDDDVAPIGVTLTKGTDMYKYGACSLLFGAVQVRADGTVHACACRDVDGSLRIGNVADAPLARIVSLSNDRYRALIDDQQRGKFLPNCRSCSMYSSIFDSRAARFATTTPLVPLAEARTLLGDGGEPDLAPGDRARTP